MKQDEYSTVRPTLKRWNKINPTAELRWARAKTDHQTPTNFVNSFRPEPSLNLRRAIKSGSEVFYRDWVKMQVKNVIILKL